MPTRRLLTVVVLALLAGSSGTAAAQLIAVKTVRVAEGDQFSFLPSANLGMAGVSIALPDTAVDPFGNPAGAARLDRSHAFGSPTFFSVTKNAGRGQTIPLGAFLTSGNSFGGLALALQTLDPRRDDNAFGPFSFDSRVALLPPGTSAGERFQEQTNRYVYAVLGHRVPQAGLSFATSAMYSGLNAVDGVELMYPTSNGLRQHGAAIDLRLGAIKEWKGNRTLEAVIVHNRFGMKHDVAFIDSYWDPGLRQIIGQQRVEQNQDRTNTWGLHLEYARPIGDKGWRAGGLFTGNRLSQPESPSYIVMGIPRDPGTSVAYNFGAGVARSKGPSKYGVDVIFEPIRSHTWATEAGSTRTFDNQFRFANAIARVGGSHEMRILETGASLRLQAGLQARAVNYWLEQRDLVHNASHDFRERWTELTRTWGVTARFAGVDLHYRGRMTSGNGLPGVSFPFDGPIPLATDALSSSFFVPTPLPNVLNTLDDVNVRTHQISVSIPFRR